LLSMEILIGGMVAGLFFATIIDFYRWFMKKYLQHIKKEGGDEK